MRTLCEKCFPYDGVSEIYATVPLTPCEECGAYDDRRNGGAVVHHYPGQYATYNLGMLSST